MNKLSIVRKVEFPALDGIRFFAAFTVFLQHFLGALTLEYYRYPELYVESKHPSSVNQWAVSYFSDGNHGVDIFFILSGFLMGRLVFANKKFNYFQFIKNRIARIYPAFFVSYILCTLIVCNIFSWPFTLKDFFANLFFLNAIADFKILAYNHVTWSLGFEFAYYFVVPSMLLLALKFDKRIVAAIALLSALLFFWHTPFVRIIGLFLGTFIATFDDRQLRVVAKKVPLFASVLLYLLCGLIKQQHYITYMTYYCMLLFAIAFLLIKCTWDSDCFLNRVFSSNTMRFLGTVSFSLYLYHSVIISLVLYKIMPRIGLYSPSSFGGAVFFLISLSITIMISYVSYILFEQLYFKRKLTANNIHRVGL